MAESDEDFFHLAAGTKKLLIQLNWLCNFRCKHCFHGTRTSLQTSLTPKDVEEILCRFKQNSLVESVTYLGGEPFLYNDLGQVLSTGKSYGLNTVVCTNGWRISHQLHQLVGLLDHLRISIDGGAIGHDIIRSRQGSYREALKSLDVARSLGMRTSVTFTATALGATELLSMANDVASVGAEFIKIHEFRPLGAGQLNASRLALQHKNLNDLHAAFHKIRAEKIIDLRIDESLFSSDARKNICISSGTDRLEIEADGSIYLSCKAVGDGTNAFRYNGTNMRFEKLKDKNVTEISLNQLQVEYAQQY